MTTRDFFSATALAGALFSIMVGAAWAGGDPQACGFKGGDPAHGKLIFNQTCAACHGQDGHGAIPGTPDFTKKGGVLSKPHADLSDHITNGFATPNAPLPMPPRGGNPALSEQDIRDVHAYLHHAFGCGK